MLTGCAMKAGNYPLSASSPMPSSPEFQVEATAQFAHAPAGASDLQLHLDLTYKGDSEARVDLSKLWWKVDGVAWRRCRHEKGIDKDTLIFNIPPDQPRSFDLVCRDIPRPYKSVALKFHTAGTGSLGVVELEFAGVPKAL